MLLSKQEINLCSLYLSYTETLLKDGQPVTEYSPNCALKGLQMDGEVN